MSGPPKRVKSSAVSNPVGIEGCEQRRQGCPAQPDAHDDSNRVCAEVDLGQHAIEGAGGGDVNLKKLLAESMLENEVIRETLRKDGNRSGASRTGAVDAVNGAAAAWRLRA